SRGSSGARAEPTPRHARAAPSRTRARRSVPSIPAMPELPEVETVRSGPLAALAGRRVQRVELYRPDLRWPIPTARGGGLAGRRLTGIARPSKYLIVEFGGPSPPCALVHLGMSGRLFVTPLRGRAAPDRQQHEHWRLFFADRVLRYVDPRRFGVLD